MLLNDATPDTGHRPDTTGALQLGVVFEDVPLTSAHILAGIALFFLLAIDAWEMMIIVYISPMISRDMHLSAVGLGSLIGAIFIGIGIGSLIWGRISEIAGRQRVIIWSLALYGVISLLSAFSPGYASLYGARLLAGIAAAGMIVTTFPLFEELLPVASRGRLAVFLAAGWPIGMILAIGATVILGPLGWRVVLGASSLATLWAFVIHRFVPESPYWLVRVGREDEAKRVVERLTRGRVRIAESQRLVVDDVAGGGVLDVFRADVLSVTLLQIAVNFTFSWGYWGLQTWLPSLLAQRGFDLPQSYGFIAISAVCMIPGYAAASWLTGRLGRKWVMAAFVAASAIAGFCFANVPGMVLLYASNVILSFFSMGAWGIWDTWLGELYPTRIRVVGYSWGTISARIANTAAPSVIGILVARASSFNATTMFIDAFLLVTAIIVLFLPETEGRDLH